MYRALVYKELRELAGIAAAALAAHLAIVSTLVGVRAFGWLRIILGAADELPFVGYSFARPFALISVMFVIALGFRQSLWEQLRGTYLFLLHRPMPRTAVMVTKLAVGVAIYLVCSAIPILLYAWWAATPGTHPSPFEWSMAEPVVRVWLTMPLIYLGAFLSGLRPARWYGSRLLPLAASGLLAFVVPAGPWPLTWVSMASLVSVAVFGSSICFVAVGREY